MRDRRLSRGAKVFRALRSGRVDVSDATRERKRKTRRHVKWVNGYQAPRVGTYSL